MKVNSDGASKGNSGPSIAALCIRDNNWDLVSTRGLKLPYTTNLVVEVVSISFAILMGEQI